MIGLAYKKPMERKALYNSLRMQYLRDPTLVIEPWRVEDLSAYAVPELLALLCSCGLELDSESFCHYADTCETPEELAHLLEGENSSHERSDHLYLIVFELWKQLVPQRPSLSIFCDALDQHICAYDKGVENGVQDALEHLHALLEECRDDGSDPHDLFYVVEGHCANSIEGFLYDYLVDQLQIEQYTYVQDLTERFAPYVQEEKWFALLGAKLAALTQEETAGLLLKKLTTQTIAHPDLEYQLDLLDFLARQGQASLFISLAKQTLPLLQLEEDLQDFLATCLLFYTRFDRQPLTEMVHKLLAQRQNKATDRPLDPLDRTLPGLLQLLKQA